MINSRFKPTEKAAIYPAMTVPLARRMDGGLSVFVRNALK
jgi:hypothetical protein